MSKPTYKELEKRVKELEKTEEELQDAEEYAQNIIDSSLDMIIAVNKERCIAEFNKAAQEAFGYSKEEVVGNHIKMLYSSEEVGRKISTAVMEKGNFIGEITNIRKNGERFPSLLSASALHNKKGEIIGKVGNSRDITEQKKAEEELRKSQKELRELSAHLQSVREMERTSIAREIHDELGQLLTALKMDLSLLHESLPQNIKSVDDKIESMTNLIDEIIESVQKISSKLRPGILDVLGLNAAIEWLTKEFHNRTGIICETVLDFDDSNINHDYSTTIFRIIQETLTNVTRHSQATAVNIKLKEKNEKLLLIIEDNGVGIKEDQISGSQSFGLLGIRERMYSVEGEVKISGFPGKGTTVTVSAPIKRK